MTAKTSPLEPIELSVIAHCFGGKLHEILSDGLKPEMFSNPDNAEIFTTIVANDMKDRTCDLVSIGSMFQTRPDIIKKLVSATEQSASTQNIGYAIGVIKSAHVRKSLLRKMHEVYTAAIRVPITDEYNLEERIAGIIGDVEVSSKNEMSNEGLTRDTIDDISRDVEAGGVRAIKTGIDILDAHLGGGLKPGRLVTVAARPGCGKTALATNITLKAAEDGFRPHYITIEISAREIIERLFCTVGRINTTSMSRRDFKSDELDRLAASAETIQRLPISVNSTTDGMWEKAEISINVACRYKQANLVVIDYIQQFHLSGKKMTAREEISHITSRCKNLAMKHKVPFLIVAQLNRDIEKRAVKEPLLSDLKESGSIEQDSDTVIMLYDKGDGDIYARIAKNRSGTNGDIRLNADLSINKFYSRADDSRDWSRRMRDT